MALTKVLTDVDIARILVPYSIKMVSYKMLSGGSANTNYLIRTEDNAFVLTICDEKSIEETEKLASLLGYLQQLKFSTSRLIQTTTGELTSTWNTKPILLKKFIEGDIAKDVSEDLLEYLGKELAKLHQIKAPDFIPREIAFGLQHFDDVKIYAPDSYFYKWLKTTQHYIENHIDTDLPKALIHSDIFNNNIIVAKDGKQATIMDFEEACYYYRVFDIGMMIIGTCSDKTTINLNKVASLLKGYQQKTTLLEIEKKALKAFTVYAATATAYWRHQNYKHVNFNPEMKDHYLEMKHLADHVMGLSERAFL